jgi:acyl carrier protein phosphodiesterase
MNWLAHLYLSEPSPEFRIGGLLPDVAPASELVGLAPGFQQGIHRHLKIDAFTDTHPVFLRSKARFSPPLRRFAGILVDVIYDHFLARDWTCFSSQPLRQFADEFYDSLVEHRTAIPLIAFERLEPMKSDDWLCSYAEIDGVATALGRISRRLRRPFDMSAGAAVLSANYAAFEQDFGEFFPEVRMLAGR